MTTTSVAAVASRCIALVAVTLMVACGAGDQHASGVRYFDDAEYRRATLEASLVSKDNHYARLRLERYGRGGEWERLPEWNPRVQPVVESEVDDGSAARDHVRLGTEARALDTSEAVRGADEKALRALGQAAFFRYPVQITRALASGD